jgi:hypothetical protein
MLLLMKTSELLSLSLLAYFILDKKSECRLRVIHSQFLYKKTSRTQVKEDRNLDL